MRRRDAGVAIMAISVSPIGTGSPSVGAYVAEAVRVIDLSGLRYELRAMHTEVEGDLPRLLALVPRIHRACFALGAQRVSTSIKIDDRRDAPSSIAGKVRSVKRRRRRPAGVRAR
jgi:uncharacterized protein (TIGR00106 family)